MHIIYIDSQFRSYINNINLLSKIIT